jgi:hypothetical protein
MRDAAHCFAVQPELVVPQHTRRPLLRNVIGEKWFRFVHAPKRAKVPVEQHDRNYPMP